MVIYNAEKACAVLDKLVIKRYEQWSQYYEDDYIERSWSTNRFVETINFKVQQLSKKQIGIIEYNVNKITGDKYDIIKIQYFPKRAVEICLAFKPCYYEQMKKRKWKNHFVFMIHKNKTYKITNIYSLRYDLSENDYSDFRF